MDLILALVIGLFLLFRVSSDKASRLDREREYKQSFENFEARKQNWIRKVTNQQIEDEISAKYDKKDKILLEELKDTENRYNGSPPISRDDCIRMLMANRHLLRYRDALYGIKVELGYGDKADAYYDNKMYFTWWINQKLIEGGVNENMYVQYNMIHFYPFGYKDYRPGFVVWEPTVFESSIEADMRHLNEIGYFKNAVKREFHM